MASGFTFRRDIPSLLSRCRSRLSCWLLVVLVGCLSLLTTACELPQVTAEDRLFLNLSLEFIGEYKLPKIQFQQTPVGGLSALAYDRQHDRFYALSDDRSELAPARFYTLKLDLAQPTPQQVQLKQVTVEGVTFLQDKTGQPFAKGTIDPEGLALSPTRSLFVSSEGLIHAGVPPSVQEFTLEGHWKRSLKLPDRYLPAQPKQPPQGVQDNQGFEALTVSPGGYGTGEVEPFRLFTATESALIQDIDPLDKVQGAKSRMLHYLVEDDRAALISEHVYPLEVAPFAAVNDGLAELLAIDQGGHFLSLERSLSPSGFGIKLFQITTGGATDSSTIASLKGLGPSVEPIRKKLLLDLNQLGILLDNLEGMAIGPRLLDGSQSLLLVSDDNFRPEQSTQFLLFRLRGVK